jgi:hypothetical protein
MATITGGKVCYGRTIKTGDFESKRVDVELTFAVDDGENYEHALDLVSRQVARKAEEMLYPLQRAKEPAEARWDTTGLPSGEATAAPAPPQAVAVAPARQADTDNKPRRGRPPKVKLVPKGEPEVEEAEKAKKYAALTLKAIDKTEAKAEAPAEVEAEIKDGVLQEACISTANRLKAVHDGAAPKLVKELRDAIAGKPLKSVAEMPQHLRAKFIAELKNLK